MHKFWRQILYKSRNIFNRQLSCMQGGKVCPCRDAKPNAESNAETAKPLRWGMAPVSLIADDFVTALKVLPYQHHVVTACTSTYHSVAQAFAAKHNIPHVYNSFQELARSPNVDVVYISSLNPFHLEICRMMLDHGKHVLCEKPLCMNEDQTLQLIGHSHSKGCFLMEGIWSRCVPAYQYIRKQIEADALGDVLNVKCTLGLPMQKVGRVMRRSLGGGVTLELGVYALQFALWVFGYAPSNVAANGKLNEDGVDEEANICMKFGLGRAAEIMLSSTKRFDNKAVIQGTKGCITVPDYWCPVKILDVNGAEKTFPLPKSDLSTYFPNRLALSFEAEEVRRCISEHKSQSDLFTHKESLELSYIEDQIRRQLGVIYTEDAVANFFK
ncbi:trans-1,2-dihydrobenzene-1,2-diol dehydrogenase-like [Bactrocera tryoni]|uniref:trans-1,2-dihydrobenzene-1,2-diol dehydrogenase-like n=1 Tax=Bactrocera tryoni TaxID=59916 RepID=UPI001A971D41|nr:trans-1,2-dihydrobenzene-1,2-diol dehydrogenase-like [Bactrocera tryoni]